MCGEARGYARKGERRERKNRGSYPRTVENAELKTRSDAPGRFSFKHPASNFITPSLMRILALSKVLAALATSGCGTTTGILCGTTGGGTSLTSSVWQSDANPVVKTIVTPATFVGGTVGGLGFGVWTGLDYDTTFNKGISFKHLVMKQTDPFDAGLFDPAPPEQYFVMLDEKILGMVKPEHRGDVREASALALALEPVKSAGAASLTWSNGTILIVSEKGARDAKEQAAKELAEAKESVAKELEELNATTTVFTLVAAHSDYGYHDYSVEREGLRIANKLLANESSIALELFIRRALRPHEGVVIRTDKTNKVITLSRKSSEKKDEHAPGPLSRAAASDGK
jgi:hypothetical protein